MKLNSNMNKVEWRLIHAMPQLLRAHRTIVYVAVSSTKCNTGVNGQNRLVIAVGSYAQHKRPAASSSPAPVAAAIGQQYPAWLAQCAGQMSHRRIYVSRPAWL